MKLALVAGDKGTVIKERLVQARPDLVIEPFKSLTDFFNFAYKSQVGYDRILIISSFLTDKNLVNDLHQYWEDSNKISNIVLVARANKDEEMVKFFLTTFTSTSVCAMLAPTGSMQVIYDGAIQQLSTLAEQYGTKDMLQVQLAGQSAPEVAPPSQDAGAILDTSKPSEVEKPPVEQPKKPEKSGGLFGGLFNKKDKKQPKQETKVEEPIPQNTQPQLDEYGGYYDEVGYYHDKDGGVFDLEGGYTDAQGNYYPPENQEVTTNIQYDEYGGYYDDQGYYYDAEGGVFDPDGNYTDAQGNFYPADNNQQEQYQEPVESTVQSNDDWDSDQNSDWENQDDNWEGRDDGKSSSESYDSDSETSNSTEQFDFQNEDMNSEEQIPQETHQEQMSTPDSQTPSDFWGDDDEGTVDTNDFDDSTSDIKSEIPEENEIQPQNQEADTSTPSWNQVNESEPQNTNDFDESFVVSEESEPTEEPQSKQATSIGDEVDINLGAANVAAAEGVYREQEEQPKVIEKTVVKEVIRTVNGSNSALANVLNGVSKKIIIVTGDRGTGITTTALSLAKRFVGNVNVLYFDCDITNHGLLSYIDYNVFRSYEQIHMEGIKRCKSSNAFNSCIIRYDDNFDLLTSDYSCECTDQDIIDAQSIVAEYSQDYGVVIVDCPSDKLHLISDLILTGVTILCVEGTKRGFMNMLCTMENSPLAMRYKKIISSRGTMFITKVGKNLDLNKLIKYISSLFVSSGADWTSMSSILFNGQIDDKALSQVLTQ